MSPSLASAIRWSVRSGAVSQATQTCLHIRPVGFAFNAETALDNHYSRPAPSHLRWLELQAKVLQESDIFVNALQSKGVHVISGNGDSDTPDAVFPNNWFSSHAAADLLSARFLLYPMAARSRQIERKPHIVSLIKQHLQLRDVDLFDLSHFEKGGKFLEGTGACCFDRVNKTVYVGLSARAHIDVAATLANYLGFRLVSFHAYDENNYPIYHTNVMMCMGGSFVILCEESIKDQNQRRHVRDAITSTGKEIIPISLEQVRYFCGNALEMQGDQGKFLALSQTAFRNFKDEQIKRILQHVDDILPIEVSTIERIGGGSVRCMIGELYL